MITTLLLLALFIIDLLIGLFFLFRPAELIEIQRRFYARINWKIEPISMSKEIRNTRLMGAFIIILALVALVFVFPPL